MFLIKAELIFRKIQTVVYRNFFVKTLYCLLDLIKIIFLYFQEQQSKRSGNQDNSDSNIPSTSRASQATRLSHTRNGCYQTIEEGKPMKFSTPPTMGDDYMNLDRRRSSSDIGLPPISSRSNNARPPSSTSQPRSRPESGSIMTKYDKPSLISVDAKLDSKPRRSHISPSSASSNQTGSAQSPVQPGSFAKHRTQSWCATATESGPKLMTLKEQNGISSHNGVNNDILRTRRLSSNSSTMNPLSKKAKSYGNLTKFSDNSSRNTNNNTTARRSSLNRYGSEQNLSGKDSLVGGQQPTIMSSQGKPRLSIGQRAKTFMGNTNKKVLRHVRSQPLLKTNGANPSLNGTCSGSVDAEPVDSDKDKHNRIMEWLIGVEYCAEPPETPEIDDTEPVQTDTAIHIVYGQDQ